MIRNPGTTTRLRTAARIATGLLVIAAPLLGQIPDTFTNLKVLPADITKPELVQTMKGFTAALGVRCNHCHVGEGDLSNFDFPADDKGHKVKTRVMMEMTGVINATYLPRVQDDDHHAPSVSCMTCHRGKKMPEE